MSKLPVWKHIHYIILYCIFTCMFILGCYWPTPTSWLKCRRGTTPLTHGAARRSTRDITVWRMYAFHLIIHISQGSVHDYWIALGCLDVLCLTSKYAVSIVDLLLDQQDPTGQPQHGPNHSHWILKWEATAVCSEGTFIHHLWEKLADCF